MKIGKIILFLFLAFNLAQAQDCKLAKNETDKFTKSKTVYTQPVKVTAERIKLKNAYSIDKVELQIKVENQNYLIHLDYFFASGLSVANTSNKLILLLDDGSTIDAPCIQDMPSQRGSAFTAIISYDFKVAASDFVRLIKSDITDIRMTAQINPIDFSISKEIRTSKLFNCVIQTN
ncbi:hypothetical protein [Flavobacterium silvaticum]|uniref:ABC transporter permease n=1 Tax=Flavobacterium silvaticum TaxID=1852020 RepID=A0A972FNE3_9FLAO|nr:hypothetical protein [Flavobacterium silvaticum]NMH28908.1 hypothetical protein [Flavobacterium silvaticum]